MEFRVSTRDLQQFEGDALAIGVFTGDRKVGPVAALDDTLYAHITAMRASGEVTGRLDEVVPLHLIGKTAPARLTLIGLGTRALFSLDRLQRASAIACRALRRAHAHHIGLALAWGDSGLNLAQAGRAITEGALLGLYEFARYRSGGRDAAGGWVDTAREDEHLPDDAIHSITILSRGREPALRAGIERGKILAEATNFARDLGNEPANDLTPTALAERAQRMAAEVGLECEIYGPQWMREQEMGALLSVAQGSVQEPRFIVLRYHGGEPGAPALGLVGKGITFDTGGISIKPAADMDAMKMDMCGGAAVIGAMMAIARFKPALNVTGIVPASENMPGGGAYRPGDILRAANGKTIEIVTTDAEGRLILADALAYAVRQGLAPLVDAATLTGAIVIALGHERAGLFTNDDALQRTLQAAADAAGERIWQMPMDPEYNEAIRSDIADIKQSGGRPAGAITAAKVLSNFVADVPWAHLDIAGVTARHTRDATSDRGATGFGVRLFAELAMLLAR